MAEIPGVGPFTAAVAVAIMGDPGAFRSGREFAAFLGLVPRHSGTGGRVRIHETGSARSLQENNRIHNDPLPKAYWV